MVAAVAWLGAGREAQAVFTLTGNGGRTGRPRHQCGFRDARPGRGDGETTSTNNIGAGWTFNLISGVSNNFGVQDPANTFYGRCDWPAAGTFRGFQLGFFNLNNSFTQAELVSNPIGLPAPGELHPQRRRRHALTTATQNKIAYRVGLRASDGTDLGTFATTLIVPSADRRANITNLQYTLDMSTVPSYVGDDVRIVIGGYNTGISTRLVTYCRSARPTQFRQRPPGGHVRRPARRHHRTRR